MYLCLGSPAEADVGVDSCILSPFGVNSRYFMTFPSCLFSCPVMSSDGGASRCTLELSATYECVHLQLYIVHRNSWWSVVSTKGFSGRQNKLLGEAAILEGNLKGGFGVGSEAMEHVLMTHPSFYRCR